MWKSEVKTLSQKKVLNVIKVKNNIYLIQIQIYRLFYDLILQSKVAVDTILLVLSFFASERQLHTCINWPLSIAST